MTTKTAAGLDFLTTNAPEVAARLLDLEAGSGGPLVAPTINITAPVVIPPVLLVIPPCAVAVGGTITQGTGIWVDDFQFNPGVMVGATAVDSPDLAGVRQSFVLNIDPPLESVGFPALSVVGATTSVVGSGITALDLTGLVICGGDCQFGSSGISDLNLPALTSVGGGLFLGTMPNLATIELPSLTFVGADLLFND